MLNSLKQSHGFTLLEVLVALAIVSITLAATIKVSGEFGVNAAYLKEKTLAQWIAENKAEEYRLAGTLPAIGKQQGDEEMAERVWRWRVTVSNTDDTRLRILRELARNPKVSQRDLSDLLDVSIGKTNYCLRALVDKGLVKVENFRKSGNKLAYAYQLTPRGIVHKAKMTRRYLQIKLREHEALQSEIEQLRKEVTAAASPNPEH